MLSITRCEDVKIGARQHCPKGVDVYFDDVGGEILDAVLLFLGRRARVVICGAISQYNNTTPVKGPSNYLSLLVNHARMEGFVVFDYIAQYGEGIRQLAGWFSSGKLKSESTWSRASKRFPRTCSSFTPVKTLASSSCRSPMSEPYGGRWLAHERRTRPERWRARSIARPIWRGSATREISTRRSRRSGQSTSHTSPRFRLRISISF